MNENDPCRSTASAAARAIAAGKLTSEALTAACLARIAAREPTIHAFTHLDPEFALMQARAADKVVKAGGPLGVLHGVPVGIKDIIDVAGFRCEHGSPIFAGRMPESDASCVAALKAAGAIVLGKTVTTELANRTARETRNPHDTARTPGGSSSGSAAGVADCMMPLALGTQTAGSVIRPASYCGVYALKPTLGLISRRGALLQSQTLDTIGVFARSIEDLALSLDALSVYDAADLVSFPRARVDYHAAVSAAAPKSARIAFVRTPVWPQGDEAMRTAIETFAKSLGASCESVDLSKAFEAALAQHGEVMAAEGALHYGPLLDARGEQLSAAITARLIAGRAVPAHAYMRALEARETLHAELAGLLDRYDAILTPSAFGAAPRDLANTGDPAFCSIWTLLGVPCLNLPLLTLDAMPLGVQLVGKRREETRLLRTGRWLDVRVKG